MNITLPSTHLADNDDVRALLAKMLQIQNGEVPSDSSVFSNLLSELQSLLAETQQKTEPADVQNVKGNLVVSAAEFARPADTTSYAVNDIVGTNPAAVITFADVARVANGSGYITNAQLVKSTATTSSAAFRLWLYNVAPVAAVDNLPFQLLYVFRNIRLGYIDFSCSTEGTGSNSASSLVTNINLKFNCALGSRDLFGVLEAKQAYAPGNAENFWLELTADQN